MIVAVDPGLRGCGVAIFERTELAAAAYVRNPVEGSGPAAWLGVAVAVREWLSGRTPLSAALVLEKPQVYRAGQSKGDPGDLIELAGVDGAIAGIRSWSSATAYLPRVWKGQVPKEIHHARINGLLVPDERARIEPCPKSLMHNVFDAIGIGMFHLKGTR